MVILRANMHPCCTIAGIARCQQLWLKLAELLLSTCQRYNSDLWMLPMAGGSVASTAPPPAGSRTRCMTNLCPEARSS